VRGQNIEVKWNTKNRKYTSLVKTGTLDVVSAGFCLDPGTGPQDALFNLRDLPWIARHGENRDLIVPRAIPWEREFDASHERELGLDDD
jgi:hypothetical protein